MRSFLNAISIGLLVCTFAVAQNSAPQKPTLTTRPTATTNLPSEATVDSFLRQQFGYQPDLTWKISSIKPSVIPGLAEISVRVESGKVQRVTALPIRWNAGRKGSPAPDVAQLVPGEANLYNAQLWFMAEGAQSVEIEIGGSAGTGRATIPVDAVARRVMGVPKSLGIVLTMLGLALVAVLVSIVGAAVRESVVDPGLAPSQRRRRQPASDSSPRSAHHRASTPTRTCSARRSPTSSTTRCG